MSVYIRTSDDLNRSPSLTYSCSQIIPQLLFSYKCSATPTPYPIPLLIAPLKRVTGVSPFTRYNLSIPEPVAQ